jgi:protein O-mannosyl-transferase
MDQEIPKAKQPVYSIDDRPSAIAERLAMTTRNPTPNLNPAETAQAQAEAQAAGMLANIASAENTAYARPSAENFLNLSLAYYQAGRFQECIAASRKALGLRPKFAEAHNNISAAYQAMGEYDHAIASARDALRIAPNYRLAKNNLALSLESKRKAQ